MNDTDNYERVCFPDPIQCPECGLHTKELLRGVSMSECGVFVTMCDACYEDDEGQWQI